jgi:tripartite motif-containing protein 2/3
LPFNFILTNILDLATTDIKTLLCTSCKSKEEAISRCNGCANFLCADCDKAHRTMRCFEEHQVVTLEATGTIHKPLYCSVHATENLKYFCYSCETPVCNECLISDHKATEHRYEVISEAEKHMRIEVEKLLNDTRSKIDYCDSENSKLESSLQELQQQHDTARNEITKTYDSLISFIEKQKEQSMSDLDTLHTEREIKIMEQIHQMEKTVEQMEYCSNFARKLLDNGNGHEVLSMKKMMSQQLIKLVETIPKVDINYSLEFVSNTKKFEELGPDVFGKFRTESTVSPKESTPPPTLPGMPPILNSTKLSLNGTGSSITTGSISVTASSPISLPTSMQSSFDGDISSFGKGFSTLMTSNLISAESPTPNLIPPPQINVPPVSSMVEYNLHRLASMVESTTPELTDPIVPNTQAVVNSNFLLDEMLNGDQQMLNNLQALAKIGDMTNGSSSLNAMGMIDSFMTSPSPILQTPSALTGINDDIKLNCFQTQFRSHDNANNLGLGQSGRAKALSMQIRVKFGALGQSRGQFNSPHGFCLGLDEEIIVADTNNHSKIF